MAGVSGAAGGGAAGACAGSGPCWNGAARGGAASATAARADLASAWETRGCGFEAWPPATGDAPGDAAWDCVPGDLDPEDGRTDADGCRATCMPQPRASPTASAPAAPQAFRALILLRLNSESRTALRTSFSVTAWSPFAKAAINALSARILTLRVSPSDAAAISRIAPALNTFGPRYPAARMRKSR